MISGGLILGGAVRIMALRTADVDLLDIGVLALPAGQHAIGVVRLDPALEEARRHREVRRVDLDPFEIHAGKPALENILADFGAKLFLHSQPALLIRARHFFLWCRAVVRNSVKRAADGAGAVTRGYFA
jgi:hypothetical protein